MKLVLAHCCKVIFIGLLTIFVYQNSVAQEWQRVPGIVAQDISVGKNGTAWATGTNQSIYRWNGTKWETMPGGAIRIAVDPVGDAWVVNAGNQIYKYHSNTKSWELKPGKAKDIGVGGDGSVWTIGVNAVPGGYDIYRWQGSDWSKVSGGALRVAVDPKGNAWVVNNSDNIFRYDGESFKSLPGSATDIGISVNGDVWCTRKDNKIYQWDGSSWTLKSGGATQISVGPDGVAWVVNSGGNVFYVKGINPISTSTTISQKDTLTKSGLVRFQNTGNIPLSLSRTTANAVETEVTKIAGNSQVELNATLGERFTVHIKDQDDVTYRTIYIVDLSKTIFLSGNVAMKDFDGKATNYSMLNIDPNLFGIDTTILNTRNLVTSMGTQQIFERLDATKGVDYEVIPPYLIKTGFIYAGYPYTLKTDKARLAYGYNSFTSGWNIAASGKAPVKGADVSGGFGYGETQNNSSSNTDIYAYSRYEALTHFVEVDPDLAYLAPKFIDRIKRITNNASADLFVKEYGTHFAKKIYYGGDLSSYLKMSSTEYMQAKSTNLDLKAAVEVSTPKSAQTKGNTTKTSQGSSYGGTLDFSMNTDEEQRNLLEKSESQFRVIGGKYTNGGDYSVDENNAAPLIVVLERIERLIDTRVFKDDSDPDNLKHIRQLVSSAVDRYIQKNIPSRNRVQLPPPQTYKVTLTRMAVTGHTDDANANTRGHVSAEVYRDNKLTQKINNPDETLWSQNSYSLDFRFSPNFSKNGGKTLYFTIYPDPSNGKFNRHFLNVTSAIREKDDIVWAPDGAHFSGNSGPIELTSLNLKPGGPSISRSLDMSSSGNGSIRISYSIQREENPFDLPGIADDVIMKPYQPEVIKKSDAIAKEAEFTLINQAGYDANFKINYIMEGQPKSYESGRVSSGWKYKLAIPPTAKNIRVQIDYHTGIEWKSITSKFWTTPSNRCIKVYGTVFSPKANENCD